MNPIDLAELAGGALQEKSQKALQDVFENMQDPNTPWKNKREVVIKLKFTQNEDRDDATCEISVEKKLAQPKACGDKVCSWNKSYNRRSSCRGIWTGYQRSDFP